MRAVGFNGPFVRSAVTANSHNHVTTTYNLLQIKYSLLSNVDMARDKSTGLLSESFIEGDPQMVGAGKE